MREFWHKEALLVRGSLPGFNGLYSRDNLIAFAGRDDVESRLVIQDGASWHYETGPFRSTRFRILPRKGWTLLVQGLNLVDARGDALLRRFSFVPYARLDDLMVSYAAPEGGVGPHFDSYDVFLLQGNGRRRWRYGRQADLSLVPDLPIKILRRFKPQHDEVLAGGDMLYLPPAYAHDGIALEPCTTYSIGFRAASHDEIAKAFLDFLHGELSLLGRYADAGLLPTRHPGRIGRAMQIAVARALQDIRWNRGQVDRFLGRFLSEPKPNVVFDPPQRPIALREFAARAATHGIALDPRTQLLYDSRNFYLNGEIVEVASEAGSSLERLADARRLPPGAIEGATPALLASLHAWYRDGFVESPGR